MTRNFLHTSASSSLPWGSEKLDFLEEYQICVGFLFFSLLVTWGPKDDKRNHKPLVEMEDFGAVKQQPPVPV